MAFLKSVIAGAKRFAHADWLRFDTGWIPETGQGGMLVRRWFFDLSVSG
jgi:hypothetical protein